MSSQKGIEYNLARSNAVCVILALVGAVGSRDVCAEVTTMSPYKYFPKSRRTFGKAAPAVSSVT